MQDDRYALEADFPAYAFVPGRHPHPITDPRGHSFGKSHPVPTPLNPKDAFSSPEFLKAVDLFNAGYYWESHETWEGLWIAAGRAGMVADFLKGLIKLAAAGVKAREGLLSGVQRHALRAAQLFESVRVNCSPDQTHFAAVSFDDLIQAARSLAEKPLVDDTPSIVARPVLPFRLKLTPPAFDSGAASSS